MTVGELVGVLDGNQSNVSKHLLILHQAGILDRERRGNNVQYSLSDSSVFKMIDLLFGEPGVVGKADFPSCRSGALGAS